MKKIVSTLFLSSTLLLAACANDQQPADDTATTDEESTTEEVVDETTVDEVIDDSETEETVEVTMLNSEGEESGTATFTETDEGVTLTYEFFNLPEGEFGMHIHETGSATAPDFEDADSHWNPSDVEHGVDSETGPHLLENQQKESIHFITMAKVQH